LILSTGRFSFHRHVEVPQLNLAQPLPASVKIIEVGPRDGLQNEQ